jgi:alpha-glucosidase/alpha-D-xyloside xylohydrolase
LETSTKPGPDSEVVKRNVLLSEMNNPAVEPIVKKYDELHYQLLPYTYTLAWEARQTGLPLIRALWLHYPDDPIARGIGREYLWGRDMLIAPVFKKGATTWDIYLPKGLWYDWWNGTSATGSAPGISAAASASGSAAPIAGGTTIHRAVDLSTMPIYVRAGAIIPFDPIRQYTAEPVSEPTTLRIYPGADGDFTLYEDDGISQDYLQGKASWIHMTWKDKTHTLTLSPGAPEGFTSEAVHRTFKVRLMTGGETRAVKYDGEALNVKL